MAALNIEFPRQAIATAASSIEGSISQLNPGSSRGRRRPQGLMMGDHRSWARKFKRAPGYLYIDDRRAR